MANMSDRARVTAARVTPVRVNYRCSSESPAATETTRSSSLLLFLLNVGNWVSAKKKNSRLTKAVSGRRRVACYVVAFAHSLPEKEHRRARFLDFSTSSSQAPSVGDRGDEMPRVTSTTVAAALQTDSLRRGEENDNIQLLETRPSEPQPRCSFPPHFPAPSAMVF
jgi:hypothetical protein